MIRAIGLTLMMVGCLTLGAVMGMAFDPNGEYCKSGQPLAPTDCRYEQSTEAPGLEVCR